MTCPHSIVDQNKCYFCGVAISATPQPQGYVQSDDVVLIKFTRETYQTLLGVLDIINRDHVNAKPCTPTTENCYNASRAFVEYLMEQIYKGFAIK